MDFEKLKKKPVKLIMENNILDDVIYLNDNLEKLFRLTETKLDHSFRDFLIVILNESNFVQHIITYREFEDYMNIFRAFVNKIEDKDKPIDANVSELNLNKFKIKINNNAVNSNTEVEDALNIVKENKLEVLVVVDSEKKYLGKIKRSSLKKRVNELLD